MKKPIEFVLGDGTLLDPTETFRLDVMSQESDEWVGRLATIPDLVAAVRAMSREDREEFMRGIELGGTEILCRGCGTFFAPGDAVPGQPCPSCDGPTGEVISYREVLEVPDGEG